MIKTGYKEKIGLIADIPEYCPGCGCAGRPVTRKTVLLMLKPAFFDRAGEKSYRFCPNSECPKVYFVSGEDLVFSTDDLRVRVGLKEREDPIPVCYCFGIDDADVRAGIDREGYSSIPQRITDLIRQGLCACPERNPSGACCLAEITRLVRKHRASM